MRSKGKKNMVPTKAKYKSNVKALAPAKFLERKRLRGIIGSRVRPSTTKKATNTPTPINRAPRTSGLPKPTFEDSRSPKTILPRPAARGGFLKKNPPPRGAFLGRVPAENRAQYQRYAGEAGPGAYRLAAPLLLERGADDGQRVWHKEGCAYPLEHSGRDQLLGAWCKAAPRGGQGKQANADREHAAPSQVIS